MNSLVLLGKLLMSLQVLLAYILLTFVSILSIRREIETFMRETVLKEEYLSNTSVFLSLKASQWFIINIKVIHITLTL